MAKPLVEASSPANDGLKGVGLRGLAIRHEPLVGLEGGAKEGLPVLQPSPCPMVTGLLPKGGGEERAKVGPDNNGGPGS